ncbi:MAG TPA: serine hydrolase [Gemmatimonadaceae bacterium]|nr:serine hydrolase [Gemmatimonadaceae bacterium]
MIPAPRPLLIALTIAMAAGSTSVRAQAAPGFTRADTTQLRRSLESIADAHRGVVGYAIHNIDTGERLSRRGDETFPTASLIKVPVMVTVYDLVAKGRLSLDDPLTLLGIDKVGGSGVLFLLHNGLTLTVRDAVALMIATSDNTATNLLLDRILIRRVWDRMEALGLPHTKVHHKVSTFASSVAPDSTAKYGLGVTTPNEMARLFELLARGQAVDARSDSLMLAMLDDNQDSYQMQRYVSGVRAPHKTGSVNAARTECAIFYLQSRVVACALTKENVDQRWLVDNEAQVTLGRIGEAVVKAWPRATSRR